MHKGFLAAASLLGALAVVLGAFGAHGLKTRVPPETVSTFQTGVQYQVYHSFALLAAGILYKEFHNKWIRWSGVCYLAGVLLFSGSLYLLTLLKAAGTTGLSGVGIITPFGGLFFIAGWLFLFLAVVKKNPAN